MLFTRTSGEFRERPIVRQRNELVDQSAALMAEFGHRHSIPFPSLPRENRTRRRASPRQIPRRLFIIQPPCCCSPFPSPPLHFTSIRATLNQRFREKRAAEGDLFAIRFQKRGEKDRGDRIWPPREIIGKKKKVMDILPSMEKISRFLFYFRSRVK